MSVARNTDPIFVTGPDRSGTTLMFALLASHPSISMTRRTNMWRWFDGQFGLLADPANLDALIATLGRYKRLGDVAIDADRIKSIVGDAPTYGEVFDAVLRDHARSAGKDRWGDKSLHTEHHADRLFSEFPDARVIHMMRDPRDRHASIVNRYDGVGRPSVAASSMRWLRSTRAGLRNVKRYEDRYLIVRYEDLAAEPLATLEAVCAFLGEDVDEAMLSMGGAPEHARGNSSFGTIDTGTISTRSIGRYKSALDPDDVTFIETVAAPHLARFGYERTGPRAHAVQALMVWLRLTGSRLRAMTRVGQERRIPPGRLAPVEYDDVA